MRELRIEEQKSISGGTRYYFIDLTTGSQYYDTDFHALKQRQLDCIANGHAVTGIEQY